MSIRIKTVGSLIEVPAARGEELARALVHLSKPPAISL